MNIGNSEFPHFVNVPNGIVSFLLGYMPSPMCIHKFYML